MKMPFAAIRPCLLLAIGEMFLFCRVAAAYNGTNAASYAESWCESRVNGYWINHVNNTNALIPGTSNYVYWYAENAYTIGDGTKRDLPGDDCSNFASQVLWAGGATLAGYDDAARKTFFKWAHLDSTLRNSPSIQIATITAQNETPTPNILVPGDLVSFPRQTHMMVIISTSPSIQLAYHSYDSCGTPISDNRISPSLYPLFGYHITGNTISASVDLTLTLPPKTGPAKC
jgi:hypothetical protein